MSSVVAAGGGYGHEVGALKKILAGLFAEARQPSQDFF